MLHFEPNPISIAHLFADIMINSLKLLNDAELKNLSPSSAWNSKSIFLTSHSIREGGRALEFKGGYLSPVQKHRKGGFFSLRGTYFAGPCLRCQIHQKQRFFFRLIKHTRKGFVLFCLFFVLLITINIWIDFDFEHTSLIKVWYFDKLENS